MRRRPGRDRGRSSSVVLVRPARSTSSAPTTTAASPSTAGLPYELPFGVKPLRSSTRARSRPGRSPRTPRGGHRPRRCAAKTTRPALINDIDQRPRARPQRAPRARPRSRRPSSRRRPRSEASGPAAKQAGLSARTRELVALIPVALLVTAGFTAVLITEIGPARQPQRLLRRLLPRGLRRHPHRHLRIRLPDADPYLFPLVRAADRVRPGDAVTGSTRAWPATRPTGSCSA